MSTHFPSSMPGPGSFGARNRGTDWLEKNRASLPDNQWVAVSGDGLVAARDRIDELTAYLQHQRIDPTDLAITFITSDAV